MTAACPDCGKEVDLGSAAREGERFAHPFCAGPELEWRQGQGSLRVVHKASCPVCDGQMEVPEGAKPGDTMSHCGKTFTLTYEFGSYALG